MLPMLPDRAADRCRGTADCEGCCCRVELSPGKAHARWSSVLVELVTIDTVMRVMNAAVAPLHFSSV